MEFLARFLLILGLVLLNGYFVASEFALVSVRKTRIAELSKKGNRQAKLVKRALDNLDSVISATQLGITIASLALGWVGEPALAHYLEPVFSFLPANLGAVSSHTVAVTIAFCIITFLHIVLGEIAPKTLALQKSESTSLVIVAPLILFSKIFHPIILLLNVSGNLVLRLVGLSGHAVSTSTHSEQEIKMILAQSGESGVIPEKEVEMVYNVFRLGDIPIKSIMVPRTDIIGFDATMTLADVEKEVKAHSQSRFPIFEDSIDKIIGFVHVKDLYQKILNKKSNSNLRDANVIREILSVPETKKADQVLRDMRKKRIHMAVINDEYGGTAGLVTLEDVLESLVGEIQDEFENPIQEIQKQDDGSYLVDGRIPIENLQNLYQFQIKGQGYTTLGGLVFGILGRQPKKGDHIELGNVKIVVEHIDGRKIRTLRLLENIKK